MGSSHFGDRVPEGVDGAQLPQLRCVHQHDLSVGLRDGHVLEDGEPASDQPFLDSVDDLVDVEHDTTGCTGDP